MGGNIENLNNYTKMVKEVYLKTILDSCNIFNNNDF